MIPADIGFSSLLKNEELCLTIAEAISYKHGIQLNGQRITGGSNLLYLLSPGRVLKLFSKDEKAFRDNEALFLKNLSGKLPVRTPVLYNTGEFQGYPYIIMGQAEGTPLSELWTDLDEAAKLKLTTSMGKLLKAMHTLPKDLAEGCVPEWSTFMEGQLTDYEKHHRDYGLNPEETEQVGEFLRRGPAIEKTEKNVICHTELMPEHLFVEYENGEPVLSALIDFEPSMLAVPQYDFAAVGIFITRGNKNLYESFLEAYQPEFHPKSSHIMRMLLLHRYCYLNWFMDFIPNRPDKLDLDALADFWYGTTASGL